MSLQQASPMEKLIVPAAGSSYPSSGAAYTRPGYQIEYSPRLVRTGKSYYGSRPTEGRMSTAAEELAIQLSIGKTGKDPRKAAAFTDLFPTNKFDLSKCHWTDTGLRVPEGYDPAKYETDGQGRKYWPREVLIGDKVVGEILVPEGRGRVVVAWDEVFGLPRVTEKIAWPHTPYTTHFQFYTTPDKDRVSGHYDVVVEFGGVFFPDEYGGGCLGVGADYVRWVADFDTGFRPVRGSLPEIEKELLEPSKPV